MEFSIKACHWNEAATHSLFSSTVDCLVIVVFKEQALTGCAQHVDRATQGLLSRRIQAGDIDGQCGTALMLHEPPGIAVKRILMIGLGKADDFGTAPFAQAIHAAARALFASRSRHVVWTVAQEALEANSASWRIRLSVQRLREAAYQFTPLKSKPENGLRLPEKITLTISAQDEKSATTAMKQGVALANGTDLTRDLGNLPGNLCTPSYLADIAKKLARSFRMKVNVLGQKQIEALKMGAFLSVAKGSAAPPKLIVLHYSHGAAKEAPIVLVGKGITFDSGGISLKPSEAMDEMKFDMCGAAAVLGTLRSVAELGLKLNVIGIIPTCENMPSGTASKPGDIVTSLSGQTIEVLNTDAEGRLILCDALSYAARFKPAVLIDAATLTGACVIALGAHYSALYATDEAIAQALQVAAEKAMDPVWRMPLDDAYQKQLESNFADMANIGGRPGGSITAACFLSRFTQGIPWAHLDVAGTAYKRGKEKGATARPVPLLTQFLIDRATD
jgi:leucyl aminopeptidase